MFEPTDAGVVALFARLRWKMLRGVLRSNGAQKVAVVIGLIASLTRRVRAAVSVPSWPDAPATTSMPCSSRSSTGIGTGRRHDRRDRRSDPARRPTSARHRADEANVSWASGCSPPRLRAHPGCPRCSFGHRVCSPARWAGLALVVPLSFASVAVLATLLLVSRTTINALGLVATRYPRVGQVIVGLSTLVFYAAFQIVPRAVAGLDDSGRDSTRHGALAFTPMGQLGRGAGDGPCTSPALVARPHGDRRRWLAPMLWVFTWTTRRLVTSVKGSGAELMPEHVDDAIGACRSHGGCAGPVSIGTVAWRGVLTRFRTPRTALETFTGAGVGLAVVLVPVLTGREAGAGAVLVGGAVQLAVLFMAGNSFGSDGPAMANELLTGVDPVVLVRAKARSVIVSAVAAGDPRPADRGDHSRASGTTFLRESPSGWAGCLPERVRRCSNPRSFRSPSPRATTRWRAAIRARAASPGCCWPPSCSGSRSSRCRSRWPSCGPSTGVRRHSSSAFAVVTLGVGRAHHAMAASPWPHGAGEFVGPSCSLPIIPAR